MISYTSIFNSIMEQFITELEKLYPLDTNLSIYKNSFFLFKKINVKKPAQSYYESVYLYENYIKSYKLYKIE